MKTSLVTGGAGFIGSHLVDRLIDEGSRVLCVDNFITGNRDNIAHLVGEKHLTLIEADVSQATENYLPRGVKVDEIFHLASPASPRGYQDAPLETYLVNSFGTHFLLEYSKAVGAKFLFASTSEVYGDPLEHPQKETYLGNVNSIGVRACYDESKRFGEMATMVFNREFDLNTRIVRIFNTYGPRMHPHDGRVIPNFVMQALENQPITVYGDGKQTRSFCYISDMVDGLVKTMNTPKISGEVFNIGNPDEYQMLELAKIIKRLTNSTSQIFFTDLPEDDPSRRKPDIEKARKMLGWEPKVKLNAGLKTTIEFFQEKIR